MIGINCGCVHHHNNNKQSDNRDCLLTAEDNDGHLGYSSSSYADSVVIAINALYHQEPLSSFPPLQPITRRRKILAGSKNGILQQLVGMLLILNFLGFCMARLCPYSHGCLRDFPSLSATASIWIGRLEIGRYIFPRLEEQLLDDADAITINTNNNEPFSKLIELEAELHELESSLSDADNVRYKVELLAELLKNHWNHHNYTAADDVEQRLRGLGAAKYEPGDVVEQLYNANTLQNRILYPFKVVKVHFDVWEETDQKNGQQSTHGSKEEDIASGHRYGYGHILDYSISDDHSSEAKSDAQQQRAQVVGIRYTIVRLLDNFVVRQIPESFLRRYVFYAAGTHALCNLGGSGMGQTRLMSCYIEECALSNRDNKGDFQHVMVRKERQEKVLNAHYRVSIKEGRGDVEEYLPIGNVQRYSF
mmetsp:Transcript_35088/g.74040  ORF Transcript_35088/g.74040 Transcript_35088/m.74040 type:complete len:420 (-) Transcript_35088:202-1461(-)|eukprot:CAMPEP_0183718316 /NCGR_PEP_ID=MMETSP0737-20130205/11609_1 /TAXON_ID=385413 /ORGANISM="Thalassiosira miniscula, Strain CCMP1093" /LENGTH=419 /DNA_ID=CAMNT_0025947857 /DNA_START=821 /DNA_END=2083 /DNA_ORIENTATION=-